jgi:thiol:disulfide interchange protein DsbA
MTRTLLAVFALTVTASVHAANWQPGKHYTVLPQPQRTHVAPGKVEVMEVFSYGCPACNQFRPTMKKIKAALPANAQLVFLPASWNQAENWPNLQRAYLTAQSLGVAEKTHDAMYDAVWNTGELSIYDSSKKLKTNLPTMEDIAKFYQRVAGVKPQDFLATCRSFGMDVKIRQADGQIAAMQVPSTPTLVVNGKYRINNETLTGEQDFIDLVKFLVAKETVTAPAPAAGTAPANKNTQFTFK